jgi:hypothetical protein
MKSKLARLTESGFGSDMFITHGPCLDCAKLIFQSGIKRVFTVKNIEMIPAPNFLKNQE